MSKNNKKSENNKVKRFFSNKPPVYNITEDGENNKKVNIFLSPMTLVLATYILLLISKFIDLTLLNRDNEYMSIIILQLMIFILPGALWCRFNGEKYIRRLRVKMFTPDTVVIIICATFAMISGGLLLSMLFSGAKILSDNFTLYDTFISRHSGTVGNTLYLILAYAALPAICEEFIYRGILCGEYERGGALRAGIISSLFFALLHFSLRNFPVYLFCGAVLCLVLYATRSLFATMAVHFLYNLFGLFGEPYLGRLYVLSGDAKLLVIVSIIVFLFFSTLFCMEAARLYRKYLRSGASSAYRKPDFKTDEEKKKAYIEVFKDPYAIAAVAVYIIAIIVSLFLG